MYMIFLLQIPNWYGLDDAIWICAITNVGLDTRRKRSDRCGVHPGGESFIKNVVYLNVNQGKEASLSPPASTSMNTSHRDTCYNF